MAIYSMNYINEYSTYNLEETANLFDNINTEFNSIIEESYLYEGAVSNLVQKFINMVKSIRDAVVNFFKRILSKNKNPKNKQVIEKEIKETQQDATKVINDINENRDDLEKVRKEAEDFKKRHEERQKLFTPDIDIKYVDNIGTITFEALEEYFEKNKFNKHAYARVYHPIDMERDRITSAYMLDLFKTGGININSNDIVILEISDTGILPPKENYAVFKGKIEEPLLETFKEEDGVFPLSRLFNKKTTKFDDIDKDLDDLLKD